MANVPTPINRTRKRVVRTYSRQSREAMRLLGAMIREGRIERGLGVQDLADRVGISRDLLRRIEQGDPRCALGVVLEVAVIAGVPLFEPEASRLAPALQAQNTRLRLLPQRVRKRAKAVKDDF